MKLTADELKAFNITLSNNAGEKVVLGYDKTANQYFIDRSQSGKVDFAKDFGNKIIAPRFSANKNTDITLVIDVASVEVFADKGLSVLTAIFFPTSDYTDITISSKDGFVIKTLNLSHLNSAWK